MKISGDTRSIESRRGRNSQAKGRKSDKPLESRRNDTEEANPSGSIFQVTGQSATRETSRVHVCTVCCSYAERMRYGKKDATL